MFNSYYRTANIDIYNTGVLSGLRSLPDGLVDLVVTSPPYWGLRDYGVEFQVWGGDIGCPHDWDLRVIQTGQKHWNSGGKVIPQEDRIIHNGRLRNMEFCSICGAWQGSLGNEPTRELFIKHILEVTGEIRRVLKDTGSFYLNFGDCHYKKSLSLIPERISIAMCDQQGWILRNKIHWVKQCYIYKEGRTIGATMPCSAKDRFNESGEDLYFFTKKKKYYSNLSEVKILKQVEGITDLRPSGVLRQKLYSNSKYWKYDYDGKGERNPKKRLVGAGGNATGNYYNVPESSDRTKNIPSYWQINPGCSHFSNVFDIEVDHFAVFPQDLVVIPIKFSCPEDGVVLDPFMGSGTVGIVARKLNRKFIGFELNREYCKLSKLRIEKELGVLFE